jgi:glycosyltransferase involved in cell wall biosynthesis
MESGQTVRLAYVVAQYPAVNHTYVLREVARLRARGFDVHTASISDPDRPAEKMADEEREELRRTFYVKRAPAARVARAHAATLLSRPLPYLKALARTAADCLLAPAQAPSHALYFIEAVTLGDWMRRLNLTHAHSHFTSSVALVLGRVFPVGVSLTIHGPMEFDDPAGFRLAQKIAASSFVCAISNFARSQLMRHSPVGQWPKIEVAPLGVDPEDFAPRPFRERPSPFEIVCVGRLAPVKAQHLLVEAVDLLTRRGREVRLRLVGDGPDRAGLERSVAARGLAGLVTFEGWLNQDRVVELYRRADAFALASFAEGVPVVLMEAMAMEIPCVATRVNGVPELIRDGIDGLLVSPSDVGELAGALARLIDDAGLRRALGEAGRRRVRERYDLETNVGRMAEIFRRRVGAGAGAAVPARPITPGRSAAGAADAAFGE